jgi:hypothetical protein
LAGDRPFSSPWRADRAGVKISFIIQVIKLDQSPTPKPVASASMVVFWISAATKAGSPPTRPLIDTAGALCNPAVLAFTIDQRMHL